MPKVITLCRSNSRETRRVCVGTEIGVVAGHVTPPPGGVG